MVIKEFRISDFLLFPGEQKLDLPTDDESNLIVVLAPNNSGKTSIIRALKFLFYGHLPDCTEATAFRLIHDRTRSAARVGTEVVGWVEVALDWDGESLCIRRSIRTRKLAKDQWMSPEIELARVHPRARNKPIPDEKGLLQTKLDTLVPETLFDAFYFKGEPLDGKLLGGVSAIRESLASFLHEDKWQEAEEAAEEIRHQYTREIAKLTEKNSEYTKILNNEELIRGHLLREQGMLGQKRKDLEAAGVEFEEVTAKLQELGSGGEGERLVGQIREYRSSLDRANKNRERADAEICRVIGNSRGLPFLLGALPAAKKILAQMQEENILPADVSERFVNRVLSARSCVCGREHTDETKVAWIQYKEKTLTVDLNRGLSDLLAAVQDDTSQSYARLSREAGGKLKQLRENRTQLVEDVQRLESAIKEAEQKLQRSPIEEIKKLTQRLRECSARRQRLQAEVTGLEDSTELTQKNLKRVKEELERARPTGAIAQKLRTLQFARTRAEKLRLLIQESREVLTKSFHQILQDSVSEYYDTAAYDGSRAKINRATLLPAIESNGQIHGNLGGGQSQLLALAYIVSLSRLRKSLHLQMQKLGIGFGKVDDQSFFLDAPFNNMTDHYAHAIAKFLHGNARQVVVLLARHQWNLVKQILEPGADRVFAFHYHTLKEKIAELKKKDPKLDDFTYEFNGAKTKLIEELEDGEEHPFTKIALIK